MYMKAKAGVQNTLTLNLPIEEARKLQIYSSERSNVYLPKNTNNEYKVLPKSINFIKIHAKTFDPGEKQVIVHAIGKWSFFEFDDLYINFIFVIFRLCFWKESVLMDVNDAVPASNSNR